MSKQQGPMELGQLRDRVAVVTGAGNHGIGWGLCCHAAGELGMHVIVLDLHEKLVREAEQRLRQLYPQVECHGLACDVTEPEQLTTVAARIADLLPGKAIGAVFANAGVIFSHRIMNSTVQEWETTLRVNVMGVVNTMHAFIPLLQAQESESIFSATASVGGLVRGDNGGASYQASKHAVVATCEALSFELARKSPQIRVHVLCPCIVASALDKTSVVNQRLQDGESSADEVEALGAGGFRLAMTPERHAIQTFEHIKAGNFYMVTDNVRPYVDHDLPFDGVAIMRERHENMQTLTLDNSDAWERRPGMAPSAIMKGPMFGEPEPF